MLKLDWLLKVKGEAKAFLILSSTLNFWFPKSIDN